MNRTSVPKVMLRSAMTMSPDAGGVFDALLGLACRGLGGSVGNGRQFVSWIHHMRTETSFLLKSRRAIPRRPLPPVENAAANRLFRRARRMTAISASTAVDLDRISNLRSADFGDQVGLVFVPVLEQNPEQLT